MLDIKRIRAEPEAVKAGARKKRIAADGLVDQALQLDQKRRTLTGEWEEIKAQQNREGKEIARLSGAEKTERIRKMGEQAARGKALEGELAKVQEELDQVLLGIPNVPDPDVPEGETDKDNVEIRRWGEIPRFDFPFKDHLKLGAELDIIDFDRAAKLAGSRTYILKGGAALLELAVLNFTLQHLSGKGFRPMIVPTLVRREAMVGTAYFPGG